MTQGEIQAFFPGPQAINFGGALYAVPALDWLLGPFWEFFRARYWATNSDKWKFRWECRDFARAYACAAQECWGASNPAGAEDSDALAVGEIWFIPDAGHPEIGHAVCAAITEAGLVFIEPQTGRPYPMTPGQLASRYFLRF